MPPDDDLARLRDARLFEPASYVRPLRKEEIFPPRPGRLNAPLEVDVGCGDGGFLLELGDRNPERDFLGLEKLLGRARKVARQAARRGLENVRAMQIDSPYAVRYLLPTAGVARVHVLFPDPWPKAKHAKNRLVQPSFCAAVHRVLEPGGEWFFKTDHEEYFLEAVAVIQASGWFEMVAWPDDALDYPQTDFERQWLAEGRPIQRARFRAAPGPPIPPRPTESECATHRTP